MRTCLPVRVETLWWLRLRRLVWLPLVLDDFFKTQIGLIAGRVDIQLSL